MFAVFVSSSACKSIDIKSTAYFFYINTKTKVVVDDDDNNNNNEYFCTPFPLLGGSWRLQITNTRLTHTNVNPTSSREQHENYKSHTRTPPTNILKSVFKIKF